MLFLIFQVEKLTQKQYRTLSRHGVRTAGSLKSFRLKKSLLEAIVWELTQGRTFSVEEKLFFLV